jgi:hypothetical protein
MTKKEAAALMQPGHLLSEEGREQLQKLRDELFLISHISFAATMEEENVAMEIRRSMLGELLESYGLRIDDVLSSMVWVTQHASDSTQRH